MFVYHSIAAKTLLSGQQLFHKLASLLGFLNESLLVGRIGTSDAFDDQVPAGEAAAAELCRLQPRVTVKYTDSNGWQREMDWDRVFYETGGMMQWPPEDD